jgi:hypothetical protein
MTFWEELMACFPLICTDCIENDASNNSADVACVFIAMGMCSPSHCLTTVRGIYVQTHKESRLTTEELLEAAFSLWSDPKLYKENSSRHRTVVSSQLQRAKT